MGDAPEPIKMLAVGAGDDVPLALKGVGPVELGRERRVTLTLRWRRRVSVKNLPWICPFINTCVVIEEGKCAHFFAKWLSGLSRFGGGAVRAYTSQREVHDLVVSVRQEKSRADCRAILDLLNKGIKLLAPPLGHEGMRVDRHGVFDLPSLHSSRHSLSP